MEAFETPNKRRAAAHAHGGHGCGGAACHSHPAQEDSAATVSGAATKPFAHGTSGPRTRIRIAQMDCPTEEALIRKCFAGMPVVEAVEFNLMQRVLSVAHRPGSLEEILAAIRSLGFTPELANGEAGAAEDLASPEFSAAPRAKPWWPMALAALAAIASEALQWSAAPSWLAAVLAIVAVGLSGLRTYQKGWLALRHGTLNINALMSIAVTGALVLGQWPEAAMVMVLFTLAEWIEARSLDRARNAIGGLMRLAPEMATVRQPDGSWREVAARSVELEAMVRVRPGERIGLDGEVVAGRSSVNQAAITGEGLPVEKGPGDAVFAGTINESGSFEYRVTARAGNTTLARIIHAVEEAQGAKAPTQRFVDRFARVYTPLVVLAALAVALAPPLLWQGAWHEWAYKALVLLVIACPCALVISTPVSIVSGLAAAARRGILIKGGVYLEEGRKLAWLALDKTGTITHGKPALTDFEVVGDADPMRCRSLAASLAARSDHPVSVAIAAASSAQELAHLPVEDFRAVAGRGVCGVMDAVSYFLGNHRFIEERGLCSSELEARLQAYESQGKTVVLLSDTTRVLALFAVADTVKPSSRSALAQLRQLGVRTVMLSGDNAHAVREIARQVGIDEARGDQLPEDKLKAIEAFAGRGTVGMVGDGINDAPALARADIGFAMGAMGTDAAIETADVALMDDDLRKVADFIRLSRSTHVVLLQNIAFALGLKAVFLALTLAGFGTMWMAVLADVGASLLVVANGLRLLRR